jgi:hypothetical protein
MAEIHAFGSSIPVVDPMAVRLELMVISDVVIGHGKLLDRGLHRSQLY